MLSLYVYCTSTSLLSALYLSSAALYLMRPTYVRQVLGDLSYRAAYLVPVMAAIKLLAVATILSRVSVVLSDLAYAGILYHLVLSGMAHLGVGKPRGAIPAMVGLVLLTLSFATQNAARETPSPYAAAAASTSSL